MAAALAELPDSANLMDVAEKIKQTAFKITRRLTDEPRVSKRLGVEKGIVDLSLAPTPAAGDSVAKILELIGVECGGPGTTALALLDDAVKKGGVMASSENGGLSIIRSPRMGARFAQLQDGAFLIETQAMTSVLRWSGHDCYSW